MSKKIEITDVTPASANAPQLLQGNDALAAAELKRLYTDAQDGIKRVIAVGLFAWQLKLEKLKRGQFGIWLHLNAPELCRESQNGFRASSSLTSYMGLTKNLLESAGWTLEKFFAAASKSQQLKASPIFLLSDPSSLDLPENVQALRGKIETIIEGKSARQLMLDFKQTEEDADGNLKVKRGRRKGQGGASAKQRAEAKAREEAKTVMGMESNALLFGAWIDEVCDLKHLPLISDAAWTELAEKAEALVAFMRQVNQARKEAR